MKAILVYAWKFLRKLDLILVLSCIFLSGFGVFLLYSMVVNSENQVITDIVVSASLYKTQLVAAVLGLSAMLVLSALDFEKLAKLWFLYVPLTIGLMLLTFTGLAYTGAEGSEGAAWIDLGFMSLQPSEFLKVAFILSFAYHIHKTQEHFNNPLNVLFLCLHAMVPIGLVLLQSDEGTAIIFIMIFIFMMFAGGLSWKYIVPALLAVPVIALVVWEYLLDSHHKKRIQILFNPEMDPLGIGNQQRQGKIALGSGMLNGKGFFGGDYSYVSEQHNDFIFAYVGQVAGFIGCMILCGVLFFLCFKMLFNSFFAKNKLGQCICVGAFAMVFTHCVLNIGMVLGVMPVIGVPLPMVSAGGTSVLSMFLAIGLVASVSSHSGRKANISYKK